MGCGCTTTARATLADAPSRHRLSAFLGSLIAECRLGALQIYVHFGFRSFAPNIDKRPRFLAVPHSLLFDYRSVFRCMALEQNLAQMITKIAHFALYFSQPIPPPSFP